MEKLRRLNIDVPDIVQSKLEVSDLLLMKGVSREWHDLISSRPFKVQHSRESQPKLSGFLYQPNNQCTPNVFSVVKYISTEREVPRLHNNNFDFIAENSLIMCSCNGLVCWKSLSGTFITTTTVHVGNPATREMVNLDWKESNQQVIGIGMTFDPCVDITSTKTNFKVVLMSKVRNQEDGNLSFHIYSHETEDWKRSDEPCVTGLQFSDNNCVSAKGVLYWLSDEHHILAFDVQQEIAYEMLVPIPTSSTYDLTCIGESNGVLQCVMLRSDRLLIYALNGPHYELNWSQELTQYLRAIEERHARFDLNLGRNILGDLLAFKDGILIFREMTFVYSYNMRTSGMDRIAHVSEFNNTFWFDTNVVPYSMSLAPLI
ncbi:hypothetical protein LINPERHAP1_LOCUS446 [Linum perenne]